MAGIVQPPYGPYYTVETRGAGLVGLATCLRCGATVTITDEDAVKMHNEWHRVMDPNKVDFS